MWGEEGAPPGGEGGTGKNWCVRLSGVCTVIDNHRTPLTPLSFVFVIDVCAQKKEKKLIKKRSEPHG